jgi:tetratricopeptide (TPR) repeat protein
LFANRYLRLLLVVLAIASCLLAIRSAVAFGVSRLLVTYSLTVGNAAAAQKASQLSPNDAEPHLASAAVLSISGAPDQAVIELERAVALRPADYVLWSELGLLRDQIGNPSGALKAFDESIKRAPYYAQPRWNRGNVYLRSGQYETAFNDLNQAAQSNPAFVPNLIDLAWAISRGDVKQTEQLITVKDDQTRIAFAKLLARQGKGTEALEQLGAVTRVPDAVRRELVDQLLSKSAFKEAYIVWNGAAARGNVEPSIYDGGFEGTLSFGETGFGWRVSRDVQAATIEQDTTQPHSGAKNLRIEFNGNSNLNVTQLLLLQPSKRYQINFASRSQEVVTGGLPVVVISDSAGEGKRLGQSQPLAKGTTNWQTFSFAFATTPTTGAVVLSLQRENCSTQPCPIFGSIFLDSFSVQELK